MGSACELECETILSLDLAYISEVTDTQAVEAVVEVKRMLGGLIGELG
jgi:hypothetical protein